MTVYSADDPRSALTAVGVNRPGHPAQEADLYVVQADAQAGIDEHRNAWYVRGQNFLIEYNVCRPGARLSRWGQADEYLLVVPDVEARFEAVAAAESSVTSGHRVVVMPPGDSDVHMLTAGRVLRIFSSRTHDLTGLAANRRSYDSPRAGVSEAELWPAPPDGYRMRAYSLDVPHDPTRFGRLFRCTTLMINLLPPQYGPRDPTRLSPHAHPDFEQGSFALDGEYVHHLRWPWDTDSRHWRSDEHLTAPSPSALVIPPAVIHTSAATGMSRNQLLDVFSPPRSDFPEDWIVNAGDYPRPAGAEADRPRADRAAPVSGVGERDPTIR